MKLSEIEAVGRTKIFTGEFRLYKDMSELNEYIKEVDVFTSEQMQEYAKANCWELINWYVETTGDVNHAAEMKIWMDDEFGGHEK
ncbi:hypothetical protein [Lactococcus lactis]|uniref:hypothetical protein n=2 Tax=Lactococcus lactis TaxID=1358 RepID=UPI00223A69E5|nr:hypothetical protein [Lactococcus lactis]MCT0442618.1 hypothetical protein [Lactococcus lactis subsp. lactis]